MKQISTQSTEYYECQVISPIDDLSSDVVAFAFLIAGTSPVPLTVWHVGEWEEQTPRILIGPLNGGLPLTVGMYGIWVKITDNPEVPVEFAEYVQVI